MKFEKFVQTIPVALAMHAGQLPAVVEIKNDGQATDASAHAPKVINGAATTEEEVVIDPQITEREEDTFQMTYVRGVESWETECQKRYDKLVTKEALGTLKRAELVELDSLQKIRRRLQSPPSGEEILERHRRDKLDRELIKLLRRYVGLHPLTKNKA